MGINTPYGNLLVDLIVDANRRLELASAAPGLPRIVLRDRQAHDLGLLACGAFSPLRTFMSEEDYRGVLSGMRLANGTLWPIPITLAVSESVANSVSAGSTVALYDSTDVLLAVLQVEEKYSCDPDAEAEAVFGSNDDTHPFFSELTAAGTVCLSGKLEVLELPRRYDFDELRRSPAVLRKVLEQKLEDSPDKLGIVAFQTRNPIHRAHEELVKRAAAEQNALVLIHPVVGPTRSEDINHFLRVRTYQVLIESHFGSDTTLSLLPLAMRFGGPREALWHAIIRRNYGATHFIVGRDHAGPGKNRKGVSFFEPFAAQELALKHATEIGMKIIPFQEMVYVPERCAYFEVDEAERQKVEFTSLSGTQVRNEFLAKGRELPEWFTRPEIAAILAEAFRAQGQGKCFWFTGLSGAGKSTTALALESLLKELGREMTMLDGDVVRKQLSEGLGFSREDRDKNILRIGYVAAEVVKHGGIAICAAISPYAETRNKVRQLMPSASQFLEVYVDTPLELCESRDPKGLYKKARSGALPNFTGVDDPYEAPDGDAIRIETSSRSPLENARALLKLL